MRTICVPQTWIGDEFGERTGVTGLAEDRREVRGLVKSVLVSRSEP